MIPRRRSAPLALGLAAMLPLQVMAGSPETPLTEPEPVFSGTPATGDWQGGYAGLGLAYADVDGDGGTDAGTVAGFHAGYRWDFGTQVVGIEADYGQSGIEIRDEDVDHVLRLKGQYGRDFGRTMAYATAGAASADTSLGSGTGLMLGAGVDFALTPSLTLGAEVTYQDFEEFGESGSGAEAATAGLRASFRF